MTVDKAVLRRMTEAAREVRDRAYAPYSGFRVGAAVLGGSGTIYTGCNVENASYGLSVCAERNAIFRAVAEGETVVRAIVIIAGDSEPAPPCGACLQVISEFSPSDDPTTVITCSADGSCVHRTIRDYLPQPFSLRGAQ